jgi:hypothetical protein
VSDPQHQQQPATPMPASTGQTIGHLAASFAATVIVMLVQFGVPISPEQQSAILSVIVTGWAFASAIYAFWHRARLNRITTIIQSPTPAQIPAPQTTSSGGGNQTN